MKLLNIFLILLFFSLKTNGSVKTVTNLGELINALSYSTIGDSIFIPANISIDATNNTITIPAGVTLYSTRSKYDIGRGGLIFSNSKTVYPGGLPMIQTGGENVTISNLRLKGATGEITDFDYTDGLAKGIHGNHKGLKVLCCEIYNFDLWGVYLYDPANSFVMNNYFHHCRNAGYGYGVWVGGSGIKFQGDSYIVGNIFSACRSAVDASGHYTNMYVLHNTFLPQQHYTSLSRHGQGSGGCKGGNKTIVTNNLLLSKQRAFTIPYSATDTGYIEIKDNTLRSLTCTTGQISSIGCDGDLVCQGITPFNQNRQYLPSFTPTIISNKRDTIMEGEMQTFTAYGADFYWWRISESKVQQPEVSSQSVTFGYQRPGVYITTLIAFKGADVTVIYKTTVVLPRIGTWVTAAIKDSYSDNLTEKFFKKMYINDIEVWSDDVEGYEGWERISVRCDSTIKSIAFELMSPNGCTQSEIMELFCWFDAISIISPSGVKFYESFEGDRILWQLKTNNNGAGVSTQNPVGEIRDGEKSFLIRKAMGADCNSGWGGKITRVFK